MKQFITGTLFGAAVMMAVGTGIAPKAVLKETVSPLGYEETLAHIQNNVTNAGWKVSALMRLDKSLAKEGKSVLPAASLKICQPDYAEKILLSDKARFVSVMMPCSIAVYEKTDGKTYISTMNTALMGHLFGGTVRRVMSGPVARETAEFVKF
ncbi:MAG TPA: DUF302 domain-containing protein [Pontiella sp.]